MADEEMEEPVNPERKVRRRKKQLYKDLAALLEFYLSDANLNKDGFFRKEMESHPEHYINMSLFMKCNKVRALEATNEDLIKSVEKFTNKLELSEDKKQIRRVKNFVKKSQEDVDSRTIYIEGLAPNTTHEDLKTLLSAYGKVEYIGIPKFPKSKDIRGFAFVEFSKKSACVMCLEKIGTKQFSQIQPFPKKGNKSMQALTKKAQTLVENGNEGNENKSEIKSRKRKHDETGDDQSEGTKKRKKEDEGDTAEQPETEKKNREKKGKKSGVEQRYGMRAISKSDWFELRKEYLKRQQSEIAALKEKLKNNTNSTYKKMETIPDTLTRVKTEETINKFYLMSLLPPKPRIHVVFVDRDLVDGRSAVVRCKTQDDSNRMRIALKTNKSVKEVQIIKGDEETQYWEKLNQSRSLQHDRKHSSTVQPQIKQENTTADTPNKESTTLNVELLVMIPNSLVKLTSKITLTKENIKELCGDDCAIEFIDLTDKNIRSAIVRCSSTADADKLIKKLQDNDTHTAQIITGDEESQYWSHLNEQRLLKYNRGKNKKVRGKDKILNRTEKIINSQNKPTVNFKQINADQPAVGKRQRKPKNKNSKIVFNDDD